MSAKVDRFLPLFGVAGLIFVWYVGYWIRIVDPVLLPSPDATLVALWKGMAGGALLHDFTQTVIRTFAAIAVAGVVAIPLGIVLGASERLYRSVEFVVDFFRSTPASAMFPLFLVIFGVGDATKIYVASFGAALVILFNVAYGVMNARKTRILAAKSMKASSIRVFRDVIFFETLPQTFIGLRTAVSLALVVVIVAEMFIGASAGMGHRIIDAQISYQLTDMYGSILVAGAMGYGLNLLLLLLERRLVHWSGH